MKRKINTKKIRQFIKDYGDGKMMSDLEVSSVTLWRWTKGGIPEKYIRMLSKLMNISIEELREGYGRER